MAKNAVAKSKTWLRPRLRVMWGHDIALGPGRVDLLEFIHRMGTLRGAADRMGVSYMRAWQLVQETNRRFDPPLVEVIRGGRSGGGAKLTRAGVTVLGLYRRMEAQCQAAVKKPWREIQKHLAG